MKTKKGSTKLASYSAKKPVTTTDTSDPLIVALDVSTYNSIEPGAINIRTNSRLSHFCRTGITNMPRLSKSDELTLYGHKVARTIATGYACVLPGADIETMAHCCVAWETLNHVGGERCELINYD